MENYRVVISSEGVVVSYKPLKIVKSILIGNGEVLAIGDASSIRDAGEKLGAEIHVYNNIILPGFVDAHMHLEELGLVLSSIDLSNTRSLDDVKYCLKKKQTMIGEWVIARGFDHNLYPGRELPTREFLDDIVPDKPLLLIHRSGHMGVVNTPGLKTLLNILEDEYIIRYVDLAKGIIYEDALYALTNYIRDNIDVLEKMSIYGIAHKHLVSNGVTSIGIAGLSYKSFEALKYLINHGLLKTRIYVYIYGDKYYTEYLTFNALKLLRNGSKLRLNGIKLFIDGALGTNTAYLTKPYNDKMDTSGKLLLSQDKLYEIVSTMSRYGLQVAIHAIGDAALDLVLETYSSFKHYVKELRHRIEHASLVRDDQLEVIDKVKPVVVVQPHFIITDKWLIEKIGVERVKWSYRFKTLYTKTYLAFSTDAPVEPVNPWETIYAAITRGVEEGLEHGRLTINEKMDLLDALDAYTRGSAYALYDDKLGCLLPGCYADYIIVDKNPFKIPLKELRKIRILETVIGGQTVYKSW